MKRIVEFVTLAAWGMLANIASEEEVSCIIPSGSCVHGYDDATKSAVISYSPDAVKNEKHTFLFVVPATIVDLFVDDTFCGIMTLGNRKIAVFHRPTKTKTVLPEDK